MPVPTTLVFSCISDADCVDANPCDGDETCAAGVCVEGEPVVCSEPTEVCVADGGEARCGPWCERPVAPNVAVLHLADALRFDAEGPIEVAAGPLGDSGDPFTPGDTVGPLPTAGEWQIRARSTDPACAEDAGFELVYTVQPAFPGPAETPTARAVSLDDPRIVGWAAAVREARLGDGVTEPWRDISNALGPAEGRSESVVSLGRGGMVTLKLDVSVADGPGDEIAVFENGFGDRFLELARVGVSSDGSTFAWFDAAARTPEPVAPFGEVDPTTVHGVAGVVRQGFGTPFDLSRLRHAPVVRRGFVDLDDIRFVRIVDIIGDGTARDAWDRPIHDPWPTTGSVGFDLDAVAVLDTRP